MTATRNNPIIVAVVGAVVSLIAFGALFYFLVVPVQSQITSYTSRYNAAYPDSTPQAQTRAQQGVLLATANVAKTKAQWTVIENTLMPPFDVSHRYQAWKQLSNELAFNLGPDVLHYMHSTGVVVLSGISLPAPPADPNTITAAPLVIPLDGSSGGSGQGGGSGGISVGGSFRQILHHVQLWNSFNRLVLIDSLSLHGNSPYMQGSYGASVIIFPQNDTAVDKPIPQATPGAAATGPGGMGAPGMGSPGMMGPRR